MEIDKAFEEYWNKYGELHASMCNGDIRQFAKEIYLSAFDTAKEDGARSVLRGIRKKCASMLPEGHCHKCDISQVCGNWRQYPDLWPNTWTDDNIEKVVKKCCSE